MHQKNEASNIRNLAKKYPELKIFTPDATSTARRLLGALSLGGSGD
jgi:hypothetical protein